jgi:hypothetical protein
MLVPLPGAPLAGKVNGAKLNTKSNSKATVITILLLFN